MTHSATRRQALLASIAMIVGLAIFLAVERIVTPRFDFTTALDARIAFWPWTWLLYILFFPFVIFMAARATPPQFHTFAVAALLAFAIALLCFALFPEHVPRPDPIIIENAFLRQRLTRLWRLDYAANGFPSLHVAMTCLACAIASGWRHRGWAAGVGAIICLSTLTTRQHTVADVLGGVVLAALCGALAAYIGRGYQPRIPATDIGRAKRPRETQTMTEHDRHRTARAASNPALRHFTLACACFEHKPWRVLAALAADWGLIALAFLSAVTWPHPMTYLAAALVIARTQLALAVLMHEGAHGLLMRARWRNDILGQTCAAGPLFLSLRTYQAGHLKHHRAPMSRDDPVAVVFGIDDYPITRGKLALRLLADLTGAGYCMSAVKMLRGTYRGILPAVKKSNRRIAAELASMLLPNGLLWAALAWAGHAWLYALLWLLPAVTLLPFLGRIRAIFEHAGLPPCRDQSQNARTIDRPSWQTFFCGPHAIHYHIEHHLYPRVPFYHLRDAHRQLMASGLLPSGHVYSGYGAVLRSPSVTRAISRHKENPLL